MPFLSNIETQVPIKALKPTQVMFWSTFIALQHPFMLKYQLDTKYVKGGGGLRVKVEQNLKIFFYPIISSKVTAAMQRDGTPPPPPPPV